LNTKPDITSDSDIKTLVDAFYSKVQNDKIIGPYFAELNWEVHLPRMYSFWSSLLFLTGSYKGFPFAAHAGLPNLSKPHFERWMELFMQTVDEDFAGENAAIIKNKVNQIATVFMIRLGIYEDGTQH
jgi:hemoglobin